MMEVTAPVLAGQRFLHGMRADQLDALAATRVVAVAAGVVPDAEDAEAPLRGMLAEALEASRQLSGLAGRQQAEIAGLREDSARLRARVAERDTELEGLRADLAVLQRMLFGRSSEKSRPGTAGDGGDGDRAGDGGGGGAGKPGGKKNVKRGPGPAAVTAPGPGPLKAIGKGLFSSGFLAMLVTERFVAGRSMNSLVTGLARHGAEISPATLAGTCAQAGALLAPLEKAIAERNKDSWHLHADERRGGCSPPVTAAARRSGGSGPSVARIPPAS